MRAARPQTPRKGASPLTPDGMIIYLEVKKLSFLRVWAEPTKDKPQGKQTLVCVKLLPIGNLCQRHDITQNEVLLF